MLNFYIRLFIRNEYANFIRDIIIRPGQKREEEEYIDHVMQIFHTNFNFNQKIKINYCHSSR